MICVIDIGNTNVSIAGAEGEQILFHTKVSTNREWDTETYLGLIRPILTEPERFSGSILSSVVPQVTGPVAEAVTAILGKAPILVGTDTDYGLTIDVDEPEKVGRDRLVDSVWAAHCMKLPTVTADLGTATTLNVILPGKVFTGGVICAGIQTGLTALGFRAAQLPKLQLEIPDHAIGKNTRECMLSGAVIGSAGVIDGVVAEIEKELGQKVSLIITGGGGEYVHPYLRHGHVYDRDMILKGLALLYKRNCPDGNNAAGEAG